VREPACGRRDLRGRDAHCWAPPAQNPASGTTAPGSHLGYRRSERRSGQRWFRAACRTRSRPWDTLTRCCARRVLAWTVFPLVVPLRSTCSSSSRPDAFAGFVATMGTSDFSGSFIIGYGLVDLPDTDQPARAAGQPGDLPVSAQGACVHAWGLGPRSVDLRSRWRDRPFRLPPGGTGSAPGIVFFAAQYPACTFPCRRFVLALADQNARLGGQCGSLLLHCSGLSPPTPCRL